MKLKSKYFKDDADLKSYIDDRENLDEKKQICFGVTFDKFDENTISYRLRYNATSGKYKVIDTSAPLIDLSKK